MSGLDAQVEVPVVATFLNWLGETETIGSSVSWKAIATVAAAIRTADSANDIDEQQEDGVIGRRGLRSQDRDLPSSYFSFLSNKRVSLGKRVAGTGSRLRAGMLNTGGQFLNTIKYNKIQ